MFRFFHKLSFDLFVFLLQKSRLNRKKRPASPVKLTSQHIRVRTGMEKLENSWHFKMVFKA